MNKFVFFLLTLIIVASSIPAQTWQPPIGILHPGFGVEEIRPARPVDWSVAVPGYYYVDQNHPQATDASNTYGTPARPRYSLPGPIPAGSYVEVHGTYSHGWGGWIHFAGNGTGDPWEAGVRGPIWIVGETPANKPAFTSLETAIYGSHIYVDSVDFRNGGSIGIYTQGGNPTHHVLVRNCEVEGVGTGRQNGVVMEGTSATAQVSHVVVSDCLLHRFGDMDIPNDNDQDASPMLIGRWCNTVWVVDNEMRDSTGSFRSGGAYDWELPEWTHHIYIGRNTLTNIQEVALWVKMGSDIVMSQNRVYQTVNRADIYRRQGLPVPPGFGWDYSIGIGAQYKPHRMWILYNDIHTMTYGIKLGSIDEGSVYMIGNTIRDIHHPAGTTYNGSSSWSEAGIQLQAGGDGCYVVNNVIFDADAGINISGQANSYVLANNIIAGIAEPNGNHLYVEHVLNQTTVGHTLFHQSSGTARIRWYNTFYTVAAFQSATGKGQGCLEADPLFTGAAAGDFTLQAGSPARDAGNAETVYQNFQSLYGLDIRVDAAGTPRPQGSGWDIGAYEYVPGGSSTQSINLQPGWNWISFNVLPSDRSLNGVFSGILAHIEQVRTQTQSALRLNGQWVGDLANMDGIQTGMMYKVRVNTACTLTVTGTRIAATTPIALVTGWNWAAYYPQASGAVGPALNSITSQVQQVRSQTQSAINTNGQWLGDLTQMAPGKGYTILMTGPGTLIYTE